jgi:hypothetical protein
MRIALLLIAVSWLLTGLYVLADPQGFYASVPGLAMMGPFNLHFIRDVGLAFVASGAATLWGAWRGVPAVAMAGIAWPLLHAGFHLQIWSHRGFPFDHIFAFDLVGVIAPPLLAALLLWRIARRPGVPA